MALADLIGVLAKHEVEFIIVGGMAAVLRGTPVNTFDLDVVYERSSANIDRLLRALDELQAIVRDDPRRLRLNQSHLQSPGHKLMETNQGPLDLLGTIEETAGFPELVSDGDWIDLGVTRARVLRLEPLIQIKQRLRRFVAGVSLQRSIATGRRQLALMGWLRGARQRNRHRSCRSQRGRSYRRERSRRPARFGRSTRRTPSPIE
ncbi:MAG TPA: hypothetical protein VHB79_30525 [Polyangiaceae bacterium]|nr:hypothetical protein [Polyangiaceae bacterium]